MQHTKRQIAHSRMALICSATLQGPVSVATTCVCECTTPSRLGLHG
jgi:hypothetical protein